MDQSSEVETQKQSWSGKNTILTLLGIAIIAIVIWYVQQSNQGIDESDVLPIGNNTTSTATSTLIEENNTEDLQSDLQGIDAGDIEEEFKGVDADLENL